MNGIESLKNYLKDKFPNARYEIHEPEHNDGLWYLDVSLQSNRVSITWKHGDGFAIAHIPEPFSGPVPHQIHPDLDMALKRVSELLTQ